MSGRIPKPGPACLNENRNNCQPIKAAKKVDDCHQVPAKKSCQDSRSEGSEKIRDILRKEFEEVEKCKRRKVEAKRDACVDKKALVSPEKCEEKKTEAPTELERNPCELEREKKDKCNNHESKCNTVSVKNPISFSFKCIFNLPLMQQITFFDLWKINKSYSSILELNNFKSRSYYRGNFFSQNFTHNTKSRNTWLYSWFY